MQNYFNYFTEIEERFQQRRGSLLILSTLDWALISTWKEAGIPLEAVLRGIDGALDKHDAKHSEHQDADYATQIAMKHNILRATLERAGLTDLPQIQPHTSAPLHYRTRKGLHRSLHKTSATHPRTQAS